MGTVSKHIATPTRVFTLKGRFTPKDEYINTTPKSDDEVGELKIKKRPNLVGFIKFEDGKLYLNDEDSHLWIYSNGKPINANKFPYFWFEDGKIRFSEPMEDVYNEFVPEKLKVYEVDAMNKDIVPGTKLYDETAISDMNAATAVYVPTIKEKDDSLKQAIKRSIIEKHIDINRLKCIGEKKYVLPNMTAALKSDTKMSGMYFNNWTEFLGLDYVIKLEDNGSDTIDPLKEPIYYVSAKNRTLTESEYMEYLQNRKIKELPIPSEGYLQNRKFKELPIPSDM